MRDPSRYGDLYWCIGLADGTEVFVNADRVKVEPNGALVTVGAFRPKEGGPTRTALSYLSFAPGAWQFFYGASCMDGSAVAVAHWPGQIAESSR